MLELFMKLKKEDLITRTFQKEELSNFDTNIIYLEYTNKELIIKNLTEGCFEKEIEIYKLICERI